MNITIAIFSLIIGYLVGWCIREILGHFRPKLRTCNIVKTGRIVRLIIAIALAVSGVVLQSMWLLILSGFVLYEASSTWCIARAIVK